MILLTLLIIIVLYMGFKEMCHLGRKSHEQNKNNNKKRLK